MVFGFVKQSRGGVQITSTPGHGTTLTMQFPAHVGAADRPRQRQSVTPSALSRQTAPVQVLLVEDQPEVRRVLAGHLRSAGHRVFEASGGGDARRLMHHGLRLDLVISDLTMPGRCRAMMCCASPVNSCPACAA